MKKEIIFLNIVLPVTIGFLIYVLFFPDILVLRCIPFLGDYEGVRLTILNHSIIPEIIRNYFLDMLWSYSLFFTLVLVSCFEQKNIKYIGMIAALFSVMMEFAQLLPLIPGTFDPIDIGVEVLAVIIAMYTLNSIVRRQGKNEN